MRSLALAVAIPSICPAESTMRLCMRSLALAVAILLAMSMAGCSTGPRAEDDWFKGGELEPTSVRTLQMTVRVLAAKGDTAGAAQVARKMLLEHPNSVASYSEPAELMVMAGQYQDAVALLSRGLEVTPNHALLLNNRGLCHMLQGDLKRATMDFQAAHDADRRDADYIGNLALAHALAGGEESEQSARRLWARVLPLEAVDQNLQLARAARDRAACVAPAHRN